MPRKKRTSLTNRTNREAAREHIRNVRTGNNEIQNQPAEQPNNVTLTNDENRLTTAVALQHEQRHITARNTTAEPVRLRRRKNDFVGCARQVDTAHFNEGIHVGLPQHNDGPLTITCQHCRALLWHSERSSFCCGNGKVNLEIPPPPPPLMMKYYNAKSSVYQSIRAYNNALAMASIGCSEVRQDGFNPTFTIQGKLYHRLGALIPPTGNDPKFAQIFFISTQDELDARLSHSGNLQRTIIQHLQQELHRVNTYVLSFKSAIELTSTEQNLSIVLRADKRKDQNAHARTRNLPTSSEVAALLPGEHAGSLDIVLRCKGNDPQELRRIHTCHRSYDPLHYVLMFPNGTDGWSLGLRKTDNKTLTASDFYCHRLQLRQGDFNVVMRCGKLTQQYAVDQWSKIESGRLEWVRSNQKTIRAEKYQGLMDAVHQNDIARVGRKIILPPTIYGSPRFYAEAFQNAMAIVRQYGKPDIFITFTCNPNWPEITNALHEGEKPCDRPDVTARVFKIKYDSLMDDLIKKQVLGTVKAYTCTIEFQKRGLPHVHILLIMHRDSKPNTPERVDTIVSAEIPDKNVNPRLYEAVTSHNIHGPCGFINPSSPCMDGENVKHCTKKFPKQFESETMVTQNTYPQYRRRSPDEGGHTHKMKVKGQDFAVDNSFVVPYNPFLTLRYLAHINVEIVCSVQSVKYLYKYVTKGQDHILFAVIDGQVDEVSNFVNARYIAASEAFWRIYGFEIHRKHPPVEKLPCHLPNEQVVIFPEDAVEQAVVDGPPVTKLTAFFDTNTNDESARHILYPDFPRFFTWNSKDKKWQRRKRGHADPETNEIMSECVGRVPTVSLSPHQAELYYLRLLLHHQTGARSFEDLRTVNNFLCPTFQEACRHLGLLEDDTEIDQVMHEATAVRFGHQLKAVFATILMYCRPSNPTDFYERHKRALCEDALRRDNIAEITPRIENEMLLEIQSILDSEGLELQKDFHLPRPTATTVSLIPKTIRDEIDYNKEFLAADTTNKYNTLNKEQKVVFDTVLASVKSQKGAIFALDACGGSGKTYVINLLLAAVRSQGNIALATAMSGIAANLLTGGRTFHSRFKVPINIHGTSTCNMSPNDANGKLMCLASFIVIDEVSMGHRHVFEAVNRTLQDLRKNDKPFGGITVLFAGDWRQVLPVVRHAGRPQIVNATLKMSPLWQHINILQLKENMRARTTGSTTEFADFILSIGNGTLPANAHNKIQLPSDIVLTSETDLINFAFCDLHVNFKNDNWLSSRAIICPTNEICDRMNDKILSLFPGQERIYTSVDSVEEGEHQYPLEFINKLCPSGLPPHRLALKRHCIIMLLRNLDPHNGHCNGTRYIVEQLHDHVIDATVTSGPHAGKRLFIPRIPLIPSENTFPFSMKRKQFPIRLAFSITANKSQGQTLQQVGVAIPSPFFTHGQLYVAMSRVGKLDSLRVYLPSDPDNTGAYTDNVVYQEILSH